MKKLFIALIASLFFVIGCSSPITSGKVTGHKFEAAHTRDGFFMAGDVPIFYTDKYPDTWFILVKDGDREQWIAVSEDTHDKLKLGDSWHKEK